VLMIQLAPKRGPSPVVPAPQPVRRAA
jgi:hypothetical protein